MASMLKTSGGSKIMAACWLFTAELVRSATCAFRSDEPKMTQHLRTTRPGSSSGPSKMRSRYLPGGTPDSEGLGMSHKDRRPHQFVGSRLETRLFASPEAATGTDFFLGSGTDTTAGPTGAWWRPSVPFSTLSRAGDTIDSSAPVVVHVVGR